MLNITTLKTFLLKNKILIAVVTNSLNHVWDDLATII